MSTKKILENKEDNDTLRLVIALHANAPGDSTSYGMYQQTVRQVLSERHQRHTGDALREAEDDARELKQSLTLLISSIHQLVGPTRCPASYPMSDHVAHAIKRLVEFTSAAERTPS